MAFCPLWTQNCIEKVSSDSLCVAGLNNLTQGIDEFALPSVVLGKFFILYIICLWDEEHSFAIQGRIED